MLSKIKYKSQSLTFRIAALLAVALLPLGLISVNQNVRLLEEARNREESTLLALTSAAATDEEAFIRMALGASEAIEAVLPQLLKSPEACEPMLKDFLSVSDALTFIGFTDRNGIVTCSSSGQGRDISDHPFVREMGEKQRRTVSVILDAPVSGMPTVSSAIPVFRDGEYSGFVGVSLRHRYFFETRDTSGDDRDFEILTFNADGEILTTDEEPDDLYASLPANRSLENLAKFGNFAFRDTSRDGKDRVYASVPIVEGTVYALGSWPPEKALAFDDIFGLSRTLLFPIAMWACSLGVAFLAVQRMVIRPMRNLRARMLMFVRNRSILEPSDMAMRPIELIEMDQTWERIATSVLRDEAELHNVIHEKTVLLKEVHHRVKNNLQLIASILNMKIRKAQSADERQALSDIQHRVMSIARVHQKLYETSSEERVRADELLQGIIDQVLDSVISETNPIDVTQNYDEVILYPDQAVPLSLAVSELLSNALKYGRVGHGGMPWITIDLTVDDYGIATFTISNSRDLTLPRPPERDGGLGQKLITAFTNQMAGSLSENCTDTYCSVTISFPIAGFVDEPLPSRVDGA